MASLLVAAKLTISPDFPHFFRVFLTQHHEPFCRLRGENCQNLSQKNQVTATTQFLAKNDPFRALTKHRQMKKRGQEGDFLHTNHGFVHVFCSFFAPFRVSVSTPKIKKSTPNFSAALTFENRRTPFFVKIRPST